MGRAIAHAYAAPGSYTVTVADGSGHSRSVRVVAAAQAAHAKVSTISPPVVEPGAATITLTVRGTDLDDARIVVAGIELASTMVDATTVQAAVPASFFTTAGSVWEVAVANANGTRKAAPELWVLERDPELTVASANPPQLVWATDTLQWVVLDGSGFRSDHQQDTVFGGRAQQPQYLSPTQIRGRVQSASYLGLPGTVDVYVRDNTTATISNVMPYTVI